MKRKMAKMLVPLIVILVISAVGIAYYSGFIKFDVAGQTFVPEYPDPETNVLYAPVYAQVDCKDTGDFNSAQGVILTNVQNCGLLGCSPYGESYFTCNNFFGCQLANYEISCASDNWLCGGGQEAVKEVRLGSSSGQILSYPYQINRADTYYFKAQCKLATCPGTWSPTGYSINVKGHLSELYVDAHGYIPAGWLAGSEGCKLVSASAQTIKNAQIVSDNPLSGVETIPPGTTKNVIVGWREDPTFGNVNPQGKYQGRDVLCQNLAGIYGIKQTATVGGKTYWQKDSILVTYSGQNSMCCDNTGCANGYYCEGYQCKANPTCTYGTCTYGDPSVCGTSGCVEEGGSFKNRVWSCSGGCCQKTDVAQQCCPVTCDRVSTPTNKYYCVPDTGCVKINVLEECGNGYCCNVQGQGNGWQQQSLNVANSPYKTQSCVLAGVNCCYNNAQDPFRGLCTSGSCVTPPPENCSRENEGCGWLVGKNCCSGLTCQGGLFGIGSTCVNNTVPEIPWTLIIIIVAGASIIVAVALAYRFTRKR